MGYQKTARELMRDEYIRFAKKTIPYYKGGEALENALDKAEILCEGKDPVLWVQAQYRYKPKDEFYPNSLHYRNGTQNYIKYLNSASTEEDMLFQVQLQYLNSAVEKTGRSDLEVLSDINLDFKPWFRVLMTREPDEELLQRYGAEAKDCIEQIPKIKALLKRNNVDLTRLYGKELNG